MLDKIKAGNGNRKSGITVAFLSRAVMAGYIRKVTLEKRFERGNL